MLIKIAFNNLAKSIKDYGIYLLTLIFSVTIFYSFNSVYDQAVTLKLMANIVVMLSGMQKVLNYVSIFVTLILAFLIVYANNFFIKRRKQEIGIYLSLGMSKYRILAIITLELMLMACLAFVLGILLGFAFSNLMNIYTANLFQADLSNLKFVVSYKAILKTMQYFGLIFVLIVFIHAIILRKQSIINIINSSKKTLKIPGDSKLLNIVLFLISIGLLAYSYYLLLSSPILKIPQLILTIFATGSIGSLLFFKSSMQFIIAVTQRLKFWYFKKINMYLSRRLNKSVASNFISMTIVCLAMFFVIMFLSATNVVKDQVNRVLNDQFAYDISFRSQELEPIYNNLPEGLIVNDEVKSHYEYDSYNIYNIDKHLESATDDFFEITLIGLSNYNNLLKNMGKSQVSLASDKYIPIVNKDFSKQNNAVLKKFTEKNWVFKISNKSLYPQMQAENIRVSNFYTSLVIIVNDADIDSSLNRNTVLLIDFVNKDASISFNNRLASLKDEVGKHYSYSSKQEEANAMMGMRFMLSYLSTYLGLVFLICCATILAIQQLGDIYDSKEDYKTISQLGCAKATIAFTVFKQCFIYFTYPLVLAFVHVFVAWNFVIKANNGAMDYSLVVPSLQHAMVYILIVYGSYFIISLLSSLRMLKYQR